MGTNLVTVRVDLVGDACKPTAQDLRLMRRMVFASTEGTEAVSYTHLTLPTIYSV